MSDAEQQRAQTATETAALRAVLERTKVETDTIADELDRGQSDRTTEQAPAATPDDTADLERQRVAQARQLEMMQLRMENLMMQKAMLARKLGGAASEPTERK